MCDLNLLIKKCVVFVGQAFLPDIDFNKKSICLPVGWVE
jgi:hypothetical protein